MPEVIIIAAMGHDRVIGYRNQLPWHLPADLAHFKSLTLNQTIVMGRKTYQSIGKPLPQRTNIILTRDPNFTAPGCLVYPSLEVAMQADSSNNRTPLWIIGGANLYAQALPYTHMMHLTMVEITTPGDTFFPVWQANEWQVLQQEQHAADAKNAYAYRFMTLQRIIAA